MKKFWNVWVEGTNGGVHYKHPTLQSARDEAERLQKMPFNENKKIYVMGLVCYCEILKPEPPIHWYIPYKEV